MNPITKYLKNLFAKQRLLGADPSLAGLVKAEALLTALINEEQVPGLAITVLKSGKTVFQRGLGYCNLDMKAPIDPGHTIFRIASVSKPIAATALAHMVADGMIALDASLYDYVPYYPKKEFDFTIRQLAGHTAGIRGYRGIEYGLNKPYTIKESIALFKDDPLLFEPGTGYHYNSYDWVLLSLAMQEASGLPFAGYVQEKVLDPLGMKNTLTPALRTEVSERSFNKGVHTIAQADQTQITTFYSKNKRGFRPAIPVDNFYKLAGGGYLSTTTDIARLGQAYLNGTILNQNALEPFLTAQTVAGKSTYYGLGWQVSEDAKGRPYYGHVGNGVGGYSNFFVYPKEQLVCAILVNCTDPKIQEVLDELVDAIILGTRDDLVS